MKRYWSTIMIVVIFLGLLSYTIYLYNSKSAKKESENVLFQADKNTITSITFAKPSPFKLVNRNGKYTLAVPEEVPTLQSPAEDIFKSASKIKYDDIISSKADNIEQYGLKNPKEILSIALSDGNSKRFSIGDKTPLGEGYYILNDETSIVYKVAAEVGDAFNKKYQDFLNKSILVDFDLNKYDSLVVSYQDKTFRFTQDENYWYYEGRQLKEDKVNEISGAIKGLVIDDIAPKDEYIPLDTQPVAKIIAYKQNSEIFNISVFKGNENIYNVVKKGVNAQYTIDGAYFSKVVNDLATQFKKTL